MGTIYNFSKNALQKIKQHPDSVQVALLTLVAATIPLSHNINSIAVILFVIYSLLSAKKSNISLTPALVIPVAFYLLMVLSLSWTIDFKSTLKALSKEAPLLFIPVAFYLNKKLSRGQVSQVLHYYSIFMCLFAVYCIGRAVINYISTNDVSVFFYHQLATVKVNAIYLSALMALAFFHLLAKKTKVWWEYLAVLFLGAFIVLLSSKNVIITVVVLTGLYFLLSKSVARRIKIASIAAFIVVVFTFGYYGKIKDRFAKEYMPNTEVADYKDSKTAAEADDVYSVSVKQAYTLEKFGPNAYFNGTAFRVYQARIFSEMLQEEPIFFTGYGLNASEQKIMQKGTEHDVYKGSGTVEGYNIQNFHNQYVQAFADLGFFGFLLVVILLIVNLVNGLKSKDFVNIAFAVVMITLFLTESFLWRQRGVVFFTLFYCLFSTCIRKKAIEKEI